MPATKRIIAIRRAELGDPYLQRSENELDPGHECALSRLLQLAANRFYAIPIRLTSQLCKRLCLPIYHNGGGPSRKDQSDSKA